MGGADMELDEKHEQWRLLLIQGVAEMVKGPEVNAIDVRVMDKDLQNSSIMNR